MYLLSDCFERPGAPYWQLPIAETVAEQSVSVNHQITVLKVYNPQATHPKSGAPQLK
jgi:hypothetical protein